MSATRSLFEEPPDGFQPDPHRAEPLVWVRKVVLLRSLQAVGDPIRVVELRRGLNIIATEQPNPDDGPVGHNVGKTLFTRLIRYCLGEPTFARDRVRKAVATALPEAYVLAEIVVGGRCWIVARPIGEGRAADSWCLEANDWQAALTDQSEVIKLSHFHDALNEATVAALAATLLPHQNRPVRWQDLLAWLSRDQYCRYRDPLEWRNTATESGTTELHAEDASILIRLVMDLLDDEERALIERHKQLLADKSQKTTAANTLSEDLAKTRRFLSRRLRIDDSMLSDDLFSEQAKLRAKQRQRRLQAQIADLSQTSGLGALQSELTAARDSMTKLQHEIDTRQADRQVAEGELASHRTASHEDYLQTLGDLAHPCPLPATDCPLKATGKNTSERNPLREMLIQQKTNDLHELDQKIVALREQLVTAATAHSRVKRRFDKTDRSASNQRRKLARQLSRVDAILAEATSYARFATDLSRLTGDLAAVERQVTESRDLQRDARGQIAKKQRLLSRHFDHVVKSLLGTTAMGRIDIDMKGIHLITDEQESSPGEAMATSGSVHSLDLSCLRASIAGLGVMPRLLIHDSPREGDLEPHLYARLFRLALELEQHFGDREPSFQYIVATTTPAPKDIAVEPFVRLTLDARQLSGLLLRRRF